MTTGDSVLRRRNGRPQACDPCRSRKVSCDHTQPVCLRCQRRKQQHQCVYTITSHSVSSAGTRTPISRSRPGIRSRREPHNPTRATSSSSSSSPASLLPDLARSPRPTSTSDSAPSSTTTPAPRQSGYLGYTSHSIVYQETAHSLSRLQGAGIPSLPAQPHVSARGGPTPGPVPAPLSPLTREMCLVVLRGLAGLDLAVVSPGSSAGMFSGWAGVLAWRIYPLVQARLGGSGEVDDSHLEEMARMLCANTAKPISEDATDLEGWVEQFIGDNLRWESLGLLFTSRDLSLAREPVGGESLLTYLSVCIDLARKFSDGNLFQLYLCYRRVIMESKEAGDASLACWSAHAESVSLMTFLGLHADADSPSYTPTFVSELRRRLFAHVFNIDKVVTSFQGRPPMLSSRYALPPLLLDIPDATFLSDEETLRRAVSELDENGWSTVGDPSSATMLRARVKLSYIKDKLIELVLSSHRQASVETLLDIKNRATEVYAEFPPTIRYSPADIEDHSIDSEFLYARILIRIEYLQNLFFAERLLQRHAAGQNTGADDSGDLLLISFDMVVLTLTFWIHADRFVEMNRDFEWLVMSYAAPGGGILCMELLRPTFAGPHHPRNASISRSSIIQQLSLLVGFLGWVSADAPNAELCASCRTVIQHVLDHTLNGGSVLSQQSQQQNDHVAVENQSLGNALGQVMDADNPFFSFELLDTYDWLRPDDMGTEGVSL